MIFHPLRNCPESEKPPEKLLGKDCIIDELSDVGVSFVVSPTSFFQVNKGAGEKLYSAIAELAHVDQDTSVVDICCASGGISLTLAKVSLHLSLNIFLLYLFFFFLSFVLKLFFCHAYRKPKRCLELMLWNQASMMPE